MAFHHLRITLICYSVPYWEQYYISGRGKPILCDCMTFLCCAYHTYICAVCHFDMPNVCYLWLRAFIYCQVLSSGKQGHHLRIDFYSSSTQDDFHCLYYVTKADHKFRFPLQCSIFNAVGNKGGIYSFKAFLCYLSTQGGEHETLKHFNIKKIKINNIVKTQ